MQPAELKRSVSSGRSRSQVQPQTWQMPAHTGSAQTLKSMQMENLR